MYIEKHWAKQAQPCISGVLICKHLHPAHTLGIARHKEFALPCLSQDVVTAVQESLPALQSVFRNKEKLDEHTQA